MGAERQDNGERAGPGGHGKGNGVEQDVVDIPRLSVGPCRLLIPFYLVVRGQQLEAHLADHQSPGQLYDRDGESEQVQHPAAGQGAYRTDGKTVQGYFLRHPLPFGEAEAADEGVDDKRRPDGVDHREKGKEGDKDGMQERLIELHKQYYAKLWVSKSSMKRSFF